MTDERRVVVFGGEGQVGQALASTGSGVEETGAEETGAEGRNFEESATDVGVVVLGRGDADLTDAVAVAAALDEHRPRAAINCAVFQPVDRCESEPEAAFRVNAVGVRELAEACAERGVPLIHLSTDYVFGGRRDSPYPESACPRPLSVYGASKLAGEALVLAASPDHAVVRTSSVYGRPAPGHGSPAFVERMIQRAREGEPTRVVNDQVVSPTNSFDLARTIWRLLDRGVSGLVHVVNRWECSWYELARHLFEAAGRGELLEPTTAEEYGAPARRPAYSALDTARLREEGLPEPRPGGEALADYLRTWHPDLEIPPGLVDAHRP